MKDKLTKRKYAKGNEKPSRYECTNKKCKWVGDEEDKNIKTDGSWRVYVCPQCGGEKFYGII